MIKIAKLGKYGLFKSVNVIIMLNCFLFLIEKNKIKGMLLFVLLQYERIFIFNRIVKTVLARRNQLEIFFFIFCYRRKSFTYVI